MPFIIDGDRVPAFWAERKRQSSEGSAGHSGTRAECVRLALINNMPDAALEDTESQFFELLNSAAGEIPVSIRLYSLPNLPRNDLGAQRLRDFYSGIDDLLNGRFDGVIVTGSEPLQPNLRDEPYWPALVNVLEWAERNTASTVLSCLAAHAGVLFSDGVARRPLLDKQFGVFEYKIAGDHILTSGVGSAVRIPHSRWNEVRADELTSLGYEVLAQSAGAGADLFVKRKKTSLFVHFQGHPEYAARTLLKEYRRDVRRFLRHERKMYPSMPRGYFDAESTKLLSAFRESALADRREDLLADFPEAAVALKLTSTWRASSVRIYRNWLQYLVSRKAETPALAALTPAERR